MGTKSEEKISIELEMNEGWPSVPISSIANAVIGGTPSRGEPQYWGGTTPWATAKDVASVSGRYLHQVEECITEKGLKSSTAKLMPEGTVVITARGTVGALAQLGQEMAFNQTCYAIAPNDNLDNNFLFYALKGTLAEMRTLTYGSVFETITKRSFDNWRIPCPQLPVQRSIAHILGTLDDKIELNRRMNQTLEEMARAIFNDWFVDFGPVRAKLEGRERYLAPELWDLFPDRLVDSELGGIPEGWELKALGDLIELAYGRGLKANSRKAGKIPVYGSNGQVGWHDEKLVDGPGIIVGRKGNPGIVSWSQGDFFPIDTSFYVVLRCTEEGLPFMFFALVEQDLGSLSADSAVPGLNRNLAYMSKQLLPIRGLSEAFNKYASTSFERRDDLEKESRSLTSLRDALLPKLVSGELRMEDSCMTNKGCNFHA